MSVEGNTVANADIGIYLHDAPRNRVLGNLLFGNRSMQICLKRDYLDQAGMAGNEVNGNAAIRTGRGQECQYQRWYGIDSGAALGVLSANRCCDDDGVASSCRFDSLPARPRIAPGRASLFLKGKGGWVRLQSRAGRLVARKASRSEVPARARTFAAMLADSTLLAPLH